MKLNKNIEALLLSTLILVPVAGTLMQNSSAYPQYALHRGVVKAEDFKIPADKIASGKQGTCEWYISKDKVLHIGPGELPNRADRESKGIFEDQNANVVAMQFDGVVKLPRVATSMFRGLKNMVSVDFTNLDTSQTMNMQSMFLSDAKLKSVDMRSLNMKNVTAMGSMFSWCSSLETVNMSGLDLPNLKNFDTVFANSKRLKSVLMPKSTPNVISIAALFQNCSSLEYIDLSTFDSSKMPPNDPANPYKGTKDFITGTTKLWQIKTGPKFTKAFDFPATDGFKWAYVGNGTLDKPEGTPNLTQYDGKKAGTYVKIDPTITSVNATAKSNIGDILVPTRGKIGTDAIGLGQLKESGWTTDTGDTPEVKVHLDDRDKWSIKDPDNYHDGSLTVDDNGLVNDSTLLGEGGKVFFYPNESIFLNNHRSPNLLNSGTIVADSYVEEDGVWKKGDGTKNYGLDKIPVPNGVKTFYYDIDKDLKYTDNHTYAAWFTKDDKLIKVDTLADNTTDLTKEHKISVPSSAAYFRTSFRENFLPQADFKNKFKIMYQKRAFIGTSPYYITKDGTLTIYDGTLSSKDMTNVISKFNDKITAIDFSKAEGKVYLPKDGVDMFKALINVTKINLANVSFEKIDGGKLTAPTPPDKKAFLNVGTGTIEEPDADKEYSSFKDGDNGVYVLGAEFPTGFAKSNNGDIAIKSLNKPASDKSIKTQIIGTVNGFKTDHDDILSAKLEADDKIVVDNGDNYHDVKLTVDNFGKVNDINLLGKGNKLFYYPEQGLMNDGYTSNLFAQAPTKKGYVNISTGEYTAGDNDVIADMAPIPKGIKTFSLKVTGENKYPDGQATFLAFFDKDKKLIKTPSVWKHQGMSENVNIKLIFQDGTATNVVHDFDIPDGAKYFRTSFSNRQPFDSINLFYKIPPETVHGYIGSSPYYITDKGGLIIFEGTMNAGDLKSVAEKYNDKIKNINFSKADGKVYMPEDGLDVLKDFTNLKKINTTNLSVEKAAKKSVKLPDLPKGISWQNVGTGTKQDPEGSFNSHSLDQVVDGWIIPFNEFKKGTTNSNIGEVNVLSNKPADKDGNTKAEPEDKTGFKTERKNIDVKLEKDKSLTVANKDNYHDASLVVDDFGKVDDTHKLLKGGKVFYYPEDGLMNDGFSSNIISQMEWVKGKTLISAGAELVDKKTSNTTDFIPVQEGENKINMMLTENTLNNDYASYFFYDKDKKSIKGSTKRAMDGKTEIDKVISTEIPANAKYFRLSLPTSQKMETLNFFYREEKTTVNGLLGTAPYYVDKDGTLVVYEGTLNVGDLLSLSAKYGKSIKAIDFSKAEGKVYIPKDGKEILKSFDKIEKINLTNVSFEKVDGGIIDTPKVPDKKAFFDVGNGTLEKPQATHEYKSFKEGDTGWYVLQDANPVGIVKSNIGNVNIESVGDIKGDSVSAKISGETPGFRTDKPKTFDANVDKDYKLTVKNADNYHDEKLTVDENGIVNDVNLLGQGGKFFFYPDDGLTTDGYSNNILSQMPAWHKNKALSGNGSEYDKKGSNTTDFIKIPENEDAINMMFTGENKFPSGERTRYMFFDENHKLLTGMPIAMDSDSVPYKLYQTPVVPGAKYFRMTLPEVQPIDSLQFYYKQDASIVHGYMGTAPYYVDKNGCLTIFEGTINKDDMASVAAKYSSKIKSIDFSKAEGKVYLPKDGMKTFTEFKNVERINLTNVDLEKVDGKKVLLPRKQKGKAWVNDDKTDVLQSMTENKSGWYVYSDNIRKLIDHDSGQDMDKTPDNEYDATENAETLSLDFVPNFDFEEQKLDYSSNEFNFKLKDNVDSLIQISKHSNSKVKLIFNFDGFGDTGFKFKFDDLNINTFKMDTRDMLGQGLEQGKTIEPNTDTELLNDEMNTGRVIESIKMNNPTVFGTTDLSGDFNTTINWTLSSAD